MHYIPKISGPPVKTTGKYSPVVTTEINKDLLEIEKSFIPKEKVKKIKAGKRYFLNVPSLKAILEDRGLNVTQLAKGIDGSKNTLYHAMRSKGIELDIKIINRICRFLNVKRSQIVL